MARVSLISSTVLLFVCATCLACGHPQHLRDDGEIPAVAIVDLDGDGVPLADLSDGVLFRFRGSDLEQTAWTMPGRHDAFLVRDLNHNGRVDGLVEMVGGEGPPDPIAFLRALDGWHTLHDIGRASNRTPNGIIDANDVVFSELILWEDLDHNGRSSPAELQSLAFAGFESIDLSAVPVDRWESGSQWVQQINGFRMQQGKRTPTKILTVRLAGR